MRVRINDRKTFNYFFIIIFGIILSIPLFYKNLDIYYNDGFYSIAKGFEFSKNFAVNEGRILTSFFNYIGTGNTILEAPLSSILLFIVNYFFNSYIFSYKFIVFCSIILSGIYMHKFSEKVSQNKNIALLSSILYMSTPIHLGQIYVNNSLDNILAFIFIPITFYGLFKLFNTTENNFHFGLGLIGMILTDLKLFLVILIAVVIYFLANFKNWEIANVRKSIIINFLAIISITSFFIFPYIQANLSTEYVSSNISKDEFLDNRVSIESLFVTQDSNTNILELGPHILIMLGFSLVAFRKIKESDKKEFLIYLIIMILFIFASTKLFPWGIFPKWISKLENSYNFLIVATLFECIICAINMNYVLKKFFIRDILIISVISFFYIYALKGFIPYNNEICDIDDYNISEIVEYRLLPEKAFSNLNYIFNRSRDVEVLKGNGEILDKNKFLTYYSFKADTYAKNTIYELPFIYYPGYEVKYDGIKLDYFESDNGLVAIEMQPEKGTHFEINYVGTDLMNFCKILSITGLIAFGVFVYKKR